jgi:hypothetical protein
MLVGALVMVGAGGRLNDLAGGKVLQQNKKQHEVYSAETYTQNTIFPEHIDTHRHPVSL